MIDRGFFLTRQAILQQLAAMPNELYLVRLIHQTTRRAGPGERLWTASLLAHGATVRFLRARNREGYDVYFHPYADGRNAGYILVDLDHTDPPIIAAMQAQGYEPCVVLQTSPGHLQAWIRVSPTPLEPAVATAISRQLARLYGGDPASTDWCHLGRLAGFTNRKPQRRTPGRYAPWVKLLHARAVLATHGAALVEAACYERRLTPAPPALLVAQRVCSVPRDWSLTAPAATRIYQSWFHRLHIAQRFPQPDFSIVDKWIAKELLRCRTPLAQVYAILQLGSPGFPRRHSNPADYLRRTLERALLEIQQKPFPPDCSRPLCGRHRDTPAAGSSAPARSRRSNSTGDK